MGKREPSVESCWYFVQLDGETRWATNCSQTHRSLPPFFQSMLHSSRKSRLPQFKPPLLVVPQRSHQAREGAHRKRPTFIPVFVLDHFLDARGTDVVSSAGVECPLHTASFARQVPFWATQNDAYVRTHQHTGWGHHANPRMAEEENVLLSTASPEMIASKYARIKPKDSSEERQRHRFFSARSTAVRATATSKDEAQRTKQIGLQQ